jgi:hypothetical protein
MSEPNVCLSVNELIVYLGVSKSTLAKWRRESLGPPYVKVGERIMYHKQAVEDFINVNTIGGVK